MITQMTFFSGTDINTLQEEGNDRNHFLSIIVNNAGIYTANITRKVTSKSKGKNTIHYNTFNNETVDAEIVDFEREESFIEYYPLDITVEEVNIPKSELELRLEEVRNNNKSYINRRFVNPLEQHTNPLETSERSPKYNYNNVKELSLFEEQLKEEPEYKELDPSVLYGEDHINKDLVNKTILQIITGDIFSPYKQNIDLNKWATNMPALYDKRFSKDADTDFQYWADTLLEFLEIEISDDKLDEKGKDYIDAIWAYDVMVALEKLPKNKYLDYFISSLERWMI
jgi:hypothetical protein